LSASRLTSACYQAAGNERQKQFEIGRRSAFITVLHLLHDEYVPGS